MDSAGKCRAKKLRLEETDTHRSHAGEESQESPPALSTHFDKTIIEGDTVEWEALRDRPDVLVERELARLLATFQVRNPQGLVHARHSAHAEPLAAQKVIQLLTDEGQLRTGMKLALVTDHVVIPLAQKKLNGYGVGGWAVERAYP